MLNQAGGLTSILMNVSAPADRKCLGLIGEIRDDQKTKKVLKNQIIH